jgi:hypothetical protein
VKARRSECIVCYAPIEQYGRGQTLKYCSLACNRRFWRDKRRGTKLGRSKPPGPQWHVCQWCLTPYQAKHRRLSYCSMRCVNTAEGARNRGTIWILKHCHCGCGESLGPRSSRRRNVMTDTYRNTNACYKQGHQPARFYIKKRVYFECGCGCGQKTSSKSGYVSAHKLGLRGKPAGEHAKKCLCGCGRWTAARTEYIPRHAPLTYKYSPTWQRDRDHAYALNQILAKLGLSESQVKRLSLRDQARLYREISQQVAERT